VISIPLSFVAWAIFMVGMLVGIAAATRRSRHQANRTEDVASVALPEIGQVAERTYNRRFGRAPTDQPLIGRTSSRDWYPTAKRPGVKHG